LQDRISTLQKVLHPEIMDDSTDSMNQLNNEQWHIVSQIDKEKDSLRNLLDEKDIHLKYLKGEKTREY